MSTTQKQLGFLDTDDQSEDLVDVGDDDDGLEWKVVKILTYRWPRNKEGRWAYRLRYIRLPDASEAVMFSIDHRRAIAQEAMFTMPIFNRCAWFNSGSACPINDRL